MTAEAVHVLRCLATTVPVARRTNRDCRDLRRAFDAVVAPLIEDKALAVPLLAWGISGGVLVRAYARLVGRAPDATMEVLAGAFTRLYDDLLDNRAAAVPDLPARMAAMFAGGSMEPRDGHERTLAALFDALCDRAPRHARPVAHRALVALHTRQVQSLRQTTREPDVAELRELALAKGGLAMLVLGGLVEPRPDEPFLIALGGFLQLVDDYQDLATDRQAEVRTCATEGALPLREVRAALRRVVAALPTGSDPTLGRRFLDGLHFWLYAAAAGRALNPRPPRGIGPAPRRMPLRVLIVRREVTR
ncbi:class 1 isoprenoid biosynthesis enzyme [Micromonospora sp. NPDC005254]|uniref:class 1 isoprenoid biosynthesis enzyme n=1 Tax=Micromonospora sp. NPDC005254 TaxID=3364229 RepID=UPI0036BCAA7F